MEKSVRRSPLPRGSDGPFEHLRDELGFDGPTFPARFAQVFWNTNLEDKTSYQISVCFVPRGMNGVDFMELRNDAFHAICRSAFKDWGNSVDGWLGTGDEVARLFGSIADFGFSSHAEFVRAIDEFSRLDEADWARAVRAGMRGSFWEED